MKGIFGRAPAWLVSVQSDLEGLCMQRGWVEALAVASIGWRGLAWPPPYSVCASNQSAEGALVLTPACC